MIKVVNTTTLVGLGIRDVARQLAAARRKVDAAFVGRTGSGAYVREHMDLAANSMRDGARNILGEVNRSVAFISASDQDEARRQAIQMVRAMAEQIADESGARLKYCNISPDTNTFHILLSRVKDAQVDVDAMLNIFKSGFVYGYSGGSFMTTNNTVNYTGDHGVVAVGNQNVVQNTASSNDIAALADLIDQIALTKEHRQKADAAITTIRQEAESASPDKGRLKAALGWIGSLASGIEATPKIIEAVEKIGSSLGIGN